MRSSNTAQNRFGHSTYIWSFRGVTEVIQDVVEVVVKGVFRNAIGKHRI
jgi:hypothetical protein